MFGSLGIFLFVVFSASGFAVKAAPNCKLTVTFQGQEIPDGGFVRATRGRLNQVYCSAICTGPGTSPALQFSTKDNLISTLASKRIYSVRSTHDRNATLNVQNMVESDEGVYYCKWRINGGGWRVRSFSLVFACPNTHMLCDNTKCIMKKDVCNGVEDCEDKKDETECALALADCPPPPAVQNAAFSPVQSSYADGANVTFTCNTGFGLQGSRIHYCNGSSWEGSLTCYEQFCETMNNPRNGTIVGNPSYKIGTYITFQCNTGYTLKGNSQLLCLVGLNESLKFDRNPPTCDVNMCPDFGVIDHARIFQATDGGIENDYGSVVKVTCEDSYVLDGHASVFCQGDGTWGPKPTCRPLDCVKFHGMNSSCVKDFVLLDTLYYMECKTDVPNTRIGAPDSTSAPNECEERSRKWMYSQFGCFCHCKIMYNKYIVKTENLDINDYLQHDNDLKWSCKEGCTKNQTNALRCMDGQMEMPSCICDANIHTGEPYTTDNTTNPSVFNTATSDRVTLQPEEVNSIQPVIVTEQHHHGGDAEHHTPAHHENTTEDPHPRVEDGSKHHATKHHGESGHHADNTTHEHHHESGHHADNVTDKHHNADHHHHHDHHHDEDHHSSDSKHHHSRSKHHDSHSKSHDSSSKSHDSRSNHHDPPSKHHDSRKQSHDSSSKSHDSSSKSHDLCAKRHVSKFDHHDSKSDHHDSHSKHHDSSSKHHDSKSDHHDSNSDHHDSKSDHHDSRSRHHDSHSKHHDSKSDHHDSKSDHHDSKSDYQDSRSKHHDSHSKYHDSKSDHHDSKSDHYDSRSKHHDSRSKHHDSQTDHHDSKSDHHDSKSDHHDSHAKSKHHDDKASPGHSSVHNGNVDVNIDVEINN